MVLGRINYWISQNGKINKKNQKQYYIVGRLNKFNSFNNMRGEK